MTSQRPAPISVHGTAAATDRPLAHVATTALRKKTSVSDTATQVVRATEVTSASVHAEAPPCVAGGSTSDARRSATAGPGAIEPRRTTSAEGLVACTPANIRGSTPPKG